jgi:hypothetical protein
MLKPEINYLCLCLCLRESRDWDPAPVYTIREKKSGDWDPAPVYTTREKGEWRLGSCSCLHKQREGRVEIGTMLLFTQPDRRESGDWDPASVYTTREKGE